MDTATFQFFVDELEKLAAIPKKLRTLVSESDAVPQFRRLLKGYRDAIPETDSFLSKYVTDRGFLTHDTTYGGLPAMEKILRDGAIPGSVGERAQYTPPGLKDVYFGRGFGYEDAGDRFFASRDSEGIFANLERLSKDDQQKLILGGVHQATGKRAPMLARVRGDYQLGEGDIAILNPSRRPNLPTLLRQVDEHGIEWAQSPARQEARRAAMLEARMRQIGLLDAAESIEDIPADEFPEMLDETLGGTEKARKAKAWAQRFLAGAQPVGPQEVEERFVRNLEGVDYL